MHDKHTHIFVFNIHIYYKIYLLNDRIYNRKPYYVYSDINIKNIWHGIFKYISTRLDIIINLNKYTKYENMLYSFENIMFKHFQISNILDPFNDILKYYLNQILYCYFCQHAYITGKI